MSSLRQSYDKVVTTHNFRFSEPMTDTGFLGGSPSMSIDASVVSSEFWVQAPPGQRVLIERARILVSDTGPQAITNYGSLLSLPNGLSFFTEINGEIVFGGSQIKENRDLIRLAVSFEIFEFTAGGRVIAFEDVFNSYGGTIELDGDTGDRFGVKLEDDFSGLIEHEIQVKGSAQLKNEA